MSGEAELYLFLGPESKCATWLHMARPGSFSSSLGPFCSRHHSLAPLFSESLETQRATLSHHCKACSFPQATLPRIENRMLPLLLQQKKRAGEQRRACTRLESAWEEGSCRANWSSWKLHPKSWALYSHCLVWTEGAARKGTRVQQYKLFISLLKRT